MQRPSTRVLFAAALLSAIATGGSAAAQLAPCDNCGGGTIEGQVYDDNDGSLTWSTGDTGVPGVDVTVVDGEGQVYAVATTTAPNGDYSFTGLPCGNYFVMLDIPAGYTQTAPPLQDGMWVVHLSADNQVASQRSFALDDTVACNAGPFVDVVHTGWDEALGTTLTGPDDDWILTSVQPDSTCIDSSGLPAVQPHLVNLPPGPTPLHGGHSAWHSAQQPPGFTDPTSYISTFPYVGTPNGEHFYQHCFCLSTDTPTGFAIDFSYYADDLASVWLNGNLLFSDATQPNHYDVNNPALPLQFDETTSNFDPSWLRRGINCLTMRVQNTGQIVTGFNALGVVSADDGMCCQDLSPVTGSIKGEKRLDVNNNGQVDPGDPLISGWDVTLYDSSGGTLQSTATDASGQFDFSPLNFMSYEVGETLPNANWTQVLPASGNFQVTLDAANPDAGPLTFLNQASMCEAASIEVTTQSGEPGTECCYTVFVDNTLVDHFSYVQVSPDASLGIFNQNAVAPDWSWLGSGNNGMNLYPASGSVPVGAQQEAGSFCLAGTSQVPGPHAEVSFIYGGGVHCPTEVTCGNSLEGIKWNDENGDGVQDPWEIPLPSWTIELVDANTGQVVATTTTGPDGSYSFAGIPFGDYTVQEVQQPGWVQTFPAAPGTHSAVFSVDDGIQFYAPLDFGNRAADPTPSDGCATLSAEDVECIDALSWTYSFDLTNDSDFAIEEVVLQAFDPVGVTATPNPTPLNPVLASGDTTSLSVTLTGAQPGEEVCFYVTVHSEQGLECCSVQTCVVLPGCSDCLNAIHGVKFYDRNGDGIRNTNDVGLAGWTINLEYPNGTVVSTTTDPWGNYWFTGLPPGVYEVYETQQTGWMQTFPATPTHTVSLSALGGEVAQNVDFGNDRVPVVIDPNDPTLPETPEAGEPAAPADPAQPTPLPMGSRDVLLATFTQAASVHEDAQLRAVTVAASGSAVDHVTSGELRLVWDVDADGHAGADDPVLASAPLRAGSQRIELTIPGGHLVDAGMSHAFLVVGDVGGATEASWTVSVVPPFGPNGPPWTALVLTLLLASALVLARRRRFVAGALAAGALAMGSCAAEPDTNPAATFQLFVMSVDTVGVDSGQSLQTLAAPQAGPLYELVD